MAAGMILVVDDEPDLRAVYELALIREGYDVDTAGSVQEGKALLEANQYQVMITDMRLPDGIGLELVKLISAQGRSERCLVVTAYGSAENAVEALKAGAFDYLTKPVNLKQLRQIVADALYSGDVQGAGTAGQNNNSGSHIHNHNSGAGSVPPSAHVQQQHGHTGAAATGQVMQRQLLGHSAPMRRVREMIAKVAPTMAPVLVHGESGTGKELVARAVHENSHRASGPFVAVNCGAIPENLVEAEFFGYRKGAFTGANEDRVGLFASAVGGTLFLDEIGELPLPMQAKLLRVIQERAVRPLGATAEEVVDVRIVSATHRKLADDVQNGRFRQDLYYRLNVIELMVPPLRERKEDIEEISALVLNKICNESGLPVAPVLEPQALSDLMNYSFPGNVRELENVLQRAVAMSDGTMIRKEDLLLQLGSGAAVQPTCALAEEGAGDCLTQSGQYVSPSSMPSSFMGDIEEMSQAAGDFADGELLPASLSEHMDAIERKMLVKALEMHRFNRTAAAAQLGLSLRQIRYRMERLGIDVPEEK